jgi:hypothetical protein
MEQKGSWSVSAALVVKIILNFIDNNLKTSTSQNAITPSHSSHSQNLSKIFWVLNASYELQSQFSYQICLEAGGKLIIKGAS